MESELIYLVERVKETTDIDLAIFKQDGSLVAGTLVEGEQAPKDLEKMVVDEKTNKTFFPLKFKNKNYTGRLLGEGLTVQKCAGLITELASNFFVKESELSRADFFKATLFNELSYSQLRHYTKKYSLPKAPCSVMVISVENGKIDDVKPVVTNFCACPSEQVIKTDSEQCALVHFKEKEDEYQSLTEYAGFLVQSILEETGIHAKIFLGGTVKSVYDLSTSYLQALSAIRMSKAENARGSVYSYKEYILVKMLEDLPKYKLNEYLEILMDYNAREIFSDPEMTTTAEEFLENSLNVSETARKLFLHRNTLMYRLDKIEKMTGLNIRKFSDAVTFRLITMLFRLVK